MEKICFRSDHFYTFIIVGIAVIAFTLYKYYTDSQNYMEKIQLAESVKQEMMNRQQTINNLKQELSFRNTIEANKDTDKHRLLNPLVPPLRRDSYLSTYQHGAISTPVNIPTRGEYGTFHQVGMLTKTGDNDPEQMMPLIGRRLYSDRWEYYTANHHNTSLKIPLSSNNTGRKELYDGDIIDVPGYSDSFKVVIYDRDSPLYIPY